jgi:hypothetical protein
MVLAGCGGSKPDKSSTRPAVAPSATAAPAPGPATSPSTAATNPTPSAGAYWPYAKLVARLAGRTVTVSNATVRLDASLVECNGDGPPRPNGSTREWSRYTCTQTIFQGGGDRDLTFDVVISSPTQLRISSARSGPE